MFIPFFIIFLWYATLFCHSFFLHRYASHRAFSMGKGWERFFFILTYILQGPSYMSPTGYGIMHRLHHAHTDTGDDPHSPHYTHNMLAMVWRSRNYYRGIMEGRLNVEEKYTKNLPTWRSFDKWAISNTSFVLWIAAYVLIFVQFAASPWMYALLPVAIGMTAVQGALMNWYGHKFGYTTYDMKNTSKNMLAFDFIFMGEAYHNNHHKYPASANFARRRFELDFVYQVMRLLSFARIIKMNEKQALS